MPLEVDSQDEFGKTALHYACEKGFELSDLILSRFHPVFIAQAVL